MLELISKKKFEFESLLWTNTPYYSKINLQKIKDLVDVFLITYKVNDRFIQGLIIEPKIKDKKSPIIIYNRGGNNINPAQSDMGLSFQSLGALSIFTLVIEYNYIVYTSQLSGYGEISGKDEFGGEDLNDIISLKELIDENPNCNSSRVGMIGYSRGGLMAYLSLTKVSWLKTIAVVGAPSNLLRNAKERPEMQKVFDVAFGGGDEDKIKRSILFNTDKLPKDSNILILHGKQDDRVNYKDSEELSKELEALNINNKLQLFENGTHTLIEDRKKRDEAIASWLNQYI